MWKLFIGVFLLISFSDSARIAFRLDNVQDYYLDNVQIAIISLFNQTKTPLTLGINGGYMGQDVYLDDFLSQILHDSSGWEVEFAVNGYTTENITFYSYYEQLTLFTNSINSIQQVLNPKPMITFTPISNVFNSFTDDVMMTLGFTHFSTDIYVDPFIYGLDGRLVGSTDPIRHFPAGAFTSNYNSFRSTPISASVTLAQVAQQVQTYGWACIQLNAEDFALRNPDGTYANGANSTQLAQLSLLIQAIINNSNYQVVPVGRLNFDAPKTQLSGSADIIPISYSCDCVVFRLDDIQDGFLVPVQTEMLNIFEEYGVPLTIGIITNHFGRDPIIYNRILDAISSEDWCMEVAHHGYNHENFSSFTYQEQSNLFAMGNVILENLFNFRPTTWIAPYNEFNQDTVAALIENGFNAFSSQVELDPPPYNFVNPTLWHLPKNASTNNEGDETHFVGIPAAETWAEALLQVNLYGYSVIMMHPQEFSNSDTVGNIVQYTNTANLTQFDELRRLIELALASGKRLVTMGDVQRYFPGRAPPTSCINGYRFSAAHTLLPSFSVLFISYFIIYIFNKMH